MSPADQLEAIATRPPHWWGGRAGSTTTSWARRRPGWSSPTGTPSTPTTVTTLLDQFNRQIFPILTPLAVDQGHPFPYISNLSLNLVVRLNNPATGEERIARVKVPPVLPRLVALPDGRRLVPLEQVVAAHLDALFPAHGQSPNTTPSGSPATPTCRSRRTRPATCSPRSSSSCTGAGSARPCGSRCPPASPPTCSTSWSPRSTCPRATCTSSMCPIDLSRPPPADRAGPSRPGRRTLVTGDPAAAGRQRRPLRGARDDDVLVHHPYESFAASVEAFVAQAADDPDVLAIKQTLYRTGDDSPVVASLIRASQAGKQVTAVVELQARFDERANIAWARALEEAGVQVIYGLVGLKTHSKISLVVRREDDDIRRYCHIGTGNYNSTTARTYEDLGLLTARPDIGADVGELFNLLTGSGDPPTLRRLVVSPVSTRQYLLSGHRRRGAGRVRRAASSSRPTA